MNTYTRLIEPVDILFFRDAIPMGASLGMGAGSRFPFPTTLHEAFRASLLFSMNKAVSEKKIPGRPKEVCRKGNWHEIVKDSPVKIAAREFRSLSTVGPFPYLEGKGLFFPVPLDCVLEKPSPKKNYNSVDQSPEENKKVILHRLQLLWEKEVAFNRDGNSEVILRCLPVSTRPPSKESELKGYWSVNQYKQYLAGIKESDFNPTKEPDFWQPEQRVGIQIDPETFASAQGQIYAGAYIRPQKGFRFACQLKLKDPRNSEVEVLKKLDWLLFGGEHRLARLIDVGSADLFADNLFNPPKVPEKDGPILLKWVLITPAIFAYGTLPGWCVENRGENLPPGFVAFDMKGRACLVSWCVGRPITVSGFDVVDWKAKDTLLAVPAGSVYYFLCENREVANELAEKLHWKPRSDFYGEKGCGYGLVSFDVQMHQTSASVLDLANQIFKQ